MKQANVAMIGVGCISGIYLENITKTFKDIKLLGVCDLVRERAENAQKKYNVPKLYETMYDAFNDPEVDIVLNLTRPYEHFEVSKAALEAGKHVYSEKPLGASLEEGKALVKLAEEKGLMLGGAPDTFMGAGIQTCRRLIDDGFIGDIVGSAAFMICHGHETWHPDPDFYYQYGGGPMFDMGPYYLTALVNLCGGIHSVMSASKKSFEKRLITSQPLAGTPIDVNVNTYIAGTIKYDSGAIGTLFTTFDVYYPYQARFEIYGSRGTLFVPDPNGFGGPVKLFRPEDGEVREVPLMYDYKENSRALGLDDMAVALRTGREARADYKQTFHVLDAITGFERSAQSGRWVKMSTKYKKHKPMVKAELIGCLDE
ncbi:MAG: Gfo/Idh/MocA family oxidoreductase [Clostridia bacterium]|nr:Gfo/Idh/MocA family oxidoreductase [Clostridia bacterium]MBQ9409255.1 Gfo/Idh/MocA family oxidoreductase [Clostridia bacterium]